MRKLIIYTFSIISFVCSPLYAEEGVKLGKIVVTASRIAQNDYKIASHVSVIDQEDIEASNAQNVGEILKQELGVHMYDNSTSKTQVIDMRGFGDTASRNTLILVNDRRVNAIDVSVPDMLQIPLESVERIEIIRGGGSVLYGDNAVGGVINIITKEGKGPISGKLSGVYGSYRTEGANLEVEGSKGFNWLGLNNDISYYFHGRYHDTGGYRDNGDVLTRDYNMRLGYSTAEKVKLSINTGWHEDHYGLPGGLNQEELNSVGRKGSVNPEDYADTRDRFFQVVLDVDPWPFQQELGHFVFDFGYRNRDTFARFGAFDFNTKRNIDTFNFNARYIFDKTLFNKEFNFVLGTDYYDTDNKILGSGSNGDDLTISKEEFGAYIFTEYEVLNNLFLSGGSRFQQASYNFDEKLPVLAFTSQSPHTSVNNVGLKYEYAKKSNVFLSAQQTFRFLATDEWYSSFSGELNKDIKHQTGEQYELGVKHNHKDISEYSATYYVMFTNNEIFFNPQSGFFGSNDNYDKTRRYGFEIEQKTNILKLYPIDFLDRLRVTTNYTYQDAKFLDGANGGKFIPFVPEHQANVGMTVGFLKHFNASLSGQFVGSRFSINDTANVTSKVKPYMTLNTKLTYNRKNMELFAGVNNITNEDYFSYVVKPVSSNAKDYYPAAGRNYNIGLTLKF